MNGDWRVRAACAGADPELFFPAAESGWLFEAQVRAAKAVCAGCPVRVECLDYALAALPYGVAGGLTVEERRGLGASRPEYAEVGGLPVGATGLEVAEAGRAAIRRGAQPGEVAGEFGVSERTAFRWAAQVRAELGDDASVGSGAGRGGGAA